MNFVTRNFDALSISGTLGDSLSTALGSFPSNPGPSPIARFKASQLSIKPVPFVSGGVETFSSIPVTSSLNSTPVSKLDKLSTFDSATVLSDVPTLHTNIPPTLQNSFRLSKLKKVDELSYSKSLSNLYSIRNPEPQYELGDEMSRALGLGNEAPSVENSSTDTSIGTLGASGLTAGAAIVAKTVFDSQSEQSFSQGTISGRIQSKNLSNQANNYSSDIMAGSMIGSAFDDFLGPVGTLGGAAIGAAVGYFSSNANNFSVNTTGGPVSASQNSLPF